MLSIIIPAREEALRLPKTLKKLQAFLNEYPYPTEIIPVIQGRDTTATLVMEIAQKEDRFHPLLDLDGKGKGRAVRLGIEAARGDTVLFMDADLSVPLNCVQELLAHFQTSPELDLLIGNRHLPESCILVPQPFLRRFSGRVFNFLLRKSGLTSFQDTQCGCKVFRASVAKKIFSKATLDGFAFDIEILLLAKRFGYQVTEFPVVWADAGNSRLGLFRDGIKALLDIRRLMRSLPPL